MQNSLVIAHQLLENAQYQAAAAKFSEVLRQDPRSVLALRGSAIAFANLNQWMEALNAIINGLGYGDYQQTDLELFLQILSSSQLVSHIAPIEQALKKALHFPTLEGKATSLLTRQLLAKYQTLLATDGNEQPRVYSLNVEKFLLDDTLICLIQRTCIAHYQVEALLLLGRKTLLQRASGGFALTRYLPFLSALACQTLLNDGLYATSATEQTQLDQLAANTTTLEGLVIRLCYGNFGQNIALWRSHQTQLNAANLPHLIHDLAFYETVISEQASGELVDETSKVVQSFYRQNPYPKWKTLTISPINLKHFFSWVDVTPPAKITVLIAGCGTGKQAIEMAISNPDVDILAIDLSPTSLAYAKQMAKNMSQKVKLANLRFELLDILAVDTLQQSFDFILSTGVLHHMQSPQAGLNALARVLKPTGMMTLGFYSQLARVRLAEYQQEALTLAQSDLAHITPEAIKQWRSQLSPAQQQREWFHSQDFFSLGGLMDALFHPQQTEYSLLELQTLLDTSGLTFNLMALSEHGKALYQHAMTEAGIVNLNQQTSLAQWHEFECENNYCFAAMYNMFVTPTITR